MFQKGTGERFKYKAAVLEKFPEAICKRSQIKGYNHNPTARYLYAVINKGKRISTANYTAEHAWCDVWLNYIKNNNKP